MKPTELAELARTMRAHHILHFKSEDVDVELHPSAFAPAPPAEPAKGLAPETEPMCRCGHHAIHGHNANGECLSACAVEVCAPAEGA